MVSTPAVAGGFVLPEEIIHYSDQVTFTKTEQSTSEERFYSVCFLTSEGALRLEGVNASLREINERYSGYCRAIHVILPTDTRNGYDFHDEEVVPCFTRNPWMNHPWFRNNFLRWIEMLPRPSDTSPGLLSYYQTPEKRRRNIRTPVKPGRWLKKYFSVILNEEQIHELSLEYSNTHNLQDVKITQDADEIEDIYINGPTSCMSHGAAAFDGDKHPARVYAGPDLGIAYTGSIDEPAGRALVWPDKKIYCSSTYGDISRIRAALQAIGYRQGSDSEFHGARIQRLMYRGDRHIVPYCDVTAYAEDHGDYLVLGSSGINLRNTNGLDSPQYTCDDCDSDMEEEDGNYIPSSDRTVCDCCYNQNYFYCKGSYESFHHSEKADLYEGNGHSYSEAFVRNSPLWFYCEGSEVWHEEEKDDKIQLWSGAASYALSWVVDQGGYFCVHVGQWTTDDMEKIEFTNGKFVNRDTFDDEDDFNDFVADKQWVIGPKIESDPNQLPLPFSEAA
ncbi:hypothetical protein AX761_23865 [Rhizobium sp. 58]|nr:hypothetical protein AX761_23865 [Rhizobium sp. 58]